MARSEKRKFQQQKNNKILKKLAGEINYLPESGEFFWIKSGALAGYASPGGYLRIRQISAHRLAFFKINGWFPDVVDHIDGDRRNNKISNLRGGTQADNLRNLECHRNGKLVGAHKSRNKWMARYSLSRNQKKYLGTFDTEREAHEAWIREARRVRK